MQQSGTVALQTGFSDSSVGYNAAAATGNCQAAGMPYKSASDPSYPQRQPQQAQPSATGVGAAGAGGQFGGQQYQASSQYAAQGYTQISSTTSCYPEGSSSGGANANPKDNLGVTDQELQALLSQKDIATSLAEDLLKHFGSEELDVKEEQQPIMNNGTLSSGPFSPSNLDNDDKIKQVKVGKMLFIFWVFCLTDLLNYLEYI